MRETLEVEVEALVAAPEAQASSRSCLVHRGRWAAAGVLAMVLLVGALVLESGHRPHNVGEARMRRGVQLNEQRPIYTTYSDANACNGFGALSLDFTAENTDSVEGCEDKCSADLRCDCAVFRRADGACWKRSRCEPDRFFRPFNGYDVLVKRAPELRPSTTSIAPTTTALRSTTTKVIDPKEVECAGSAGAEIGDAVCCGQHGTLDHEDHICPSSAPHCVGYVFGSKWGSCQEVTPHQKKSTSKIPSVAHEAVCPPSCSLPDCKGGHPRNGGVALHGSTCLQTCSKPHSGVRHCGVGDAYKDEDHIDCTGCAQVALEIEVAEDLRTMKPKSDLVTMIHKGHNTSGSVAQTALKKKHASEKHAGVVRVVQSCQNCSNRQAQHLQRLEDLFFVLDKEESDDSDDILIDVSPPERDQELLGFGGAFTEAGAIVFKGLSAQLQQEVIGRYFGTEGIGYTLGRVPINSCDFSPASYSFDDVDKDYGLIHFDTGVTHDQETLIPFIKNASAAVKSMGRSLQLLASPWSPPAWMKTNWQMGGSNRPGLREECKVAWANYFVKWISAYKNQGLPIWAVTVQNEPDNTPGWEACAYTAQQEADFLGAQLGPAISSAHPEVKVFTFDMYGAGAFDWAKTVQDHPDAKQYASGVAMHWYAGDMFQITEKIHKAYPELLLISSEATWERGRWSVNYTVEDGQWNFGEGYAHDIIGNLNAGSVSWIDWNLLLNQDGGPNHVGNVCDAAIQADVSKQRLYIHPQYYFIAHFSKFIAPGSKRIVAKSSGTGTVRFGGPYGSCTKDDGLQFTSFERPDYVIVTVVLNCGDKALSFRIRHRGRLLKASIPPHAIQTYMFDSQRQMRVLSKSS